jgi:hypothetical protein
MTSGASHRRRWYCIVAVAAIGIGYYCYKSRIFTEPRRPPMSFNDTSDELKETVIVPTLDSPIAEGKSAIWCASFQLAWNRLKDDVAQGPVQIANAQTIADRLNRADQSEDDLDPDAVFAAAGLAKDGIVEQIQAQMARRFPKVPRPDLDVPPTGAVAYAYLAASSKYDYPFFENDEPFLFTDSAGKQTPVGSFGIRGKDNDAYHQLRRQVQVLYADDETMRHGGDISEFVLDLCRTSEPYQIVLARMNRKATLADTLADVELKVATRPSTYPLFPLDTVLVPNMAWKVSHRFKELEGEDKRFSNPALRDLHLDTAIQTIQFRLDRSGAELAAESKVFMKQSPCFFHVNRPFLLYLKKRGGKRPFFIMWVENAELLEKK